MLVDAAPDLVNHTCSKGGRALAYLTRLATLQELFASSARHGIQIDVNHADVDGDTALHVAMMVKTGPGAVELLLEKGADVFGVGSEDATVLMKPFPDDHEDEAEEENDEEDEKRIDLTISDSLKALLDHVLSLDVAAPVPAAGKRTSLEVEREDHHEAKRLKR
jgi:hypothetical protein